MQTLVGIERWRIGIAPDHRNRIGIKIAQDFELERIALALEQANTIGQVTLRERPDLGTTIIEPGVDQDIVTPLLYTQ
ncbi:hypothetical protein D3C72_2448670 [compost metagenome]